MTGDSADIAWVCWVDGDRWSETRHEILRDEEGGEMGRSAHSRSGEVGSASACTSTIEAFAAPAPPDRTVDSPLFVESLELLRVDAVWDWFDGGAGALGLHALPEGVSLRLRTVEDESLQATSTSRRPGGRMEADSTRDGARHELDAGPAAIRLPDPSSTALVVDVEVARRARDFRRMVTEDLAPQQRIRIVALAVAAERVAPAPRERRPPRPFAVHGGGSWSEHAADVFRRHGRIDGDLVVESFHEWMMRSGPAEWLVVFCREDAPVEYALSPFYLLFPVENGRSFCDAAQRTFVLEE